ncbi:hypothetical protein Rsub_08614 [Raphidocelis subcapitata]|uniref:Ubiquinone biosynthesis protein n=1 Tax=Raphidocelis subcapitata TaxID=307507 RepID=A0A2V0P9K7_9CHLO|nr:hypothetical protein Rsub_08614 [Raphidocelis subcapitata]|eukprot:GBF95632.1 hypothetical protein Rsub_08614 [Raphidocelis subcapitata]
MQRASAAARGLARRLSAVRSGGAAAPLAATGAPPRAFAGSYGDADRSDSGDGAAGAAASASCSGRPEESPEQSKRRVVGGMLREAQVAEAGMAAFFGAQRLLLRGRPDAAYYSDQEAAQLARVQDLMPRFRTRPSLLLAAARAAGGAAGAAAAAAPRQLRDALLGGLQDALTEAYNAQLAELRRRGLSDEEPEVRALLLALRDLERAPEGAPLPPDVIALQQASSIGDVGVQGVVGAAAKALTLAVLGAARRL